MPIRVHWQTEGTVAQAPKLYCGELSSAGDKTNVYSASLESGAIEQLGTVTGIAVICQASRDGRALYIGKVRQVTNWGGTGELVRWDIATGQETVLERGAFSVPGFRLSPDEQWIVRGAEPLRVEVRATSGGDWKPLVTVNKAATMRNVASEFALTPDGKWVVYHDVDSGGKHGLFRVPISGGSPERLGDYFGPAGDMGHMEISPDGRQILAEHRDVPQVDLWLVQNFIPAAPKR